MNRPARKPSVGCHGPFKAMYPPSAANLPSPRHGWPDADRRGASRGERWRRARRRRGTRASARRHRRRSGPLCLTRPSSVSSGVRPSSRPRAIAPLQAASPHERLGIVVESAIGRQVKSCNASSPVWPKGVMAEIYARAPAPSARSSVEPERSLRSARAIGSPSIVWVRRVRYVGRLRGRNRRPGSCA